METWEKIMIMIIVGIAAANLAGIIFDISVINRYKKMKKEQEEKQNHKTNQVKKIKNKI